VERIPRHIGEWREASDRDDDGAAAARGPPAALDDDAIETRSGKFDGVDDPVEPGRAAWRRAGRRARSRLEPGG